LPPGPSIPSPWKLCTDCFSASPAKSPSVLKKTVFFGKKKIFSALPTTRALVVTLQVVLKRKSFFQFVFTVTGDFAGEAEKKHSFF
jgi:hypothetical protein